MTHRVQDALFVSGLPAAGHLTNPQQVSAFGFHKGSAARQPAGSGSG